MIGEHWSGSRLGTLMIRRCEYGDGGVIEERGMHVSLRRS